MVGWRNDIERKPKPCAVCGTVFTPKSGCHKFCSGPCRGKWKYITGAGGTAYQYGRVSGNWRNYFLRLCNQKGRAGVLSADECLLLLEQQDYRCALSGVTMTCLLEVGTKCHTNASIDRIQAGGSYEPGNVQLVCAAVNLFRGAHSVDAFIHWCRKVAEHDDEKKRLP